MRLENLTCSALVPRGSTPPLPPIDTACHGVEEACRFERFTRHIYRLQIIINVCVVLHVVVTPFYPA